MLFGIWIGVAQELNNFENYIYVTIFLLSIILILFDKKVKEYFVIADVKKVRKEIDVEQI